jgi:hypothetical protein
MRTMYDAVAAAGIPADPQMVAGYCDTIRIPQWTDADWARFPRAVKVRIAKKAGTPDGHVLDVESGNATPAQAPGWVLLRRSAGMDPSIYCNTSTWPAVRAAFTAAGVAQPHYWIARYDNDPTIPAGAVAKQHTQGATFDTSSVADVWPGVDTGTAREDLAMLVTPSNDDYVSVPCNGLRSLFIAAAYGRTVAILELWAIGDTPATRGQAVRTALGPGTIDPDRPGPIPLPANTRSVTLRFKADHTFTTWCA